MSTCPMLEEEMLSKLGGLFEEAPFEQGPE